MAVKSYYEILKNQSKSANAISRITGQNPAAGIDMKPPVVPNQKSGGAQQYFDFLKSQAKGTRAALNGRDETYNMELADENLGGTGQEYYNAMKKQAEDNRAAVSGGAGSGGTGVGTGGMSYEQYLARAGSDPDRDHDRNVRQAETDYAKAMASYGNNGEILSRAGLGGSGYSDYIGGAAFAAMQNAKVESANARSLAHRERGADYYEYLASQAAAASAQNQALRQSEAAAAEKQRTEQAAAEEKQKEFNISAYELAKTRATEGKSLEQIKTEIGRYYNLYGAAVPEDLDSMLSEAYGLGSGTYTAAQAAENEAAAQAAAARQQQLNAEVMRLLSEGTAANVAREQLRSLGYTDAETDAAIAAFGSTYTTDASNRISAATALEELDAYSAANIRALVTQKTVTEAQGAEMLRAAQVKRGEILKTEFDDLTGENEAAFFEGADTLYKRGDIDYGTYRDLYVERVKATLESCRTESEPVVALAQTVTGIQQLKKTIGNQLTEELISVAERGLTVYNTRPTPGLEASAWGLTFTVSYNGAYENIGAIYSDTVNKSIDSVGKKGELMSRNGKLYVYYGGWREITHITSKSAGGKENAAALYKLLANRYATSKYKSSGTPDIIRTTDGKIITPIK